MNELDQRLRRDAARVSAEISPDLESRWRRAVQAQTLPSRKSALIGSRWFVPMAGATCVLAVAVVLAVALRSSQPPSPFQPVQLVMTPPVLPLDLAVLEREAIALRSDVSTIKEELADLLNRATVAIRAPDEAPDSV